MRAVVLALLVAGCTADNPDYLPPSLRVFYNYDAGKVEIPDTGPDMPSPTDMACPPGYLDCDGTPGCELVLFDPKNCGACAVACDLGTDCINGACVTVDMATGRTADMLATCDGAPCALPGAEVACVNGACLLLKCKDGFANCDGDDRNGCETELATDPANCGACKAGCSGAGITVVCMDGQCIGSCKDHFADCDGNKRSNGCETDLRLPANCGACGNKCSGGTPLCYGGAGVCLSTCGNNWKCPNGTCVDRFNDPDNCGGCYSVCPNGQRACVNGVCK